VRRTTLALLIALLAAATTAACSQEPSTTQESAAKPAAPAAQPFTPPQGGEPVQLDPTQFTTRIDNRWWPMRPGSRWVYRETDGQGTPQRVVVTVTDKTKPIIGIQARVVHDVVTEDGQLVEDTYDWYAQDAKGNVWYLGEDTKEYEDGKVTTTEGSWQAGVDGAQPGILLLADPKRAMEYRQEYYKGQAEDAARVLSLDMRATRRLSRTLWSTSSTRQGWGRCWPSPSRAAPAGWSCCASSSRRKPSVVRQKLHA
jgi:hypothetical protein